MEAANTTSIQDLPVEVLEHIFQFLSAEDLNACLSVSHSWKSILNSNRIWKRWCIYPEKYFKSKSVCGPIDTSQELCTWRQYYERQQRICENWSKGQYTEMRLPFSQTSSFLHFHDEHGYHWLFQVNTNEITVWNITSTPVIHCTMHERYYFGVKPLSDKILVFHSNYIKVFKFCHPEYKLRLQCRFLFDKDDILPVDEVVPDDHNLSCVHFILVGYVLIGYSGVVTNIHETFLHIWDINSSKKIGTESVFQQSYVDFVNSVTGSGIPADFQGSLRLFPSDTNRFLVVLINDRFKLCQISLYSLDEMRFVGVIAQLETAFAQCQMEGDVVVTYHVHNRKFARLSVFNVHGQCLMYQDCSTYYNIDFTYACCFCGSKLIFKVDRKIHVVTIINAKIVNHSEFEVVGEKFIETFVAPKFLLLFTGNSNLPGSERYIDGSVWNVESGQELWKLKNTRIISDSVRNKSVHPGKLAVRFLCNNFVSILNFE